MHLEKTLDTNITELLAELKRNWEIEFQQKNINFCEVFTQNNKAIIYYNPNIVDNESIAHELLHIWLKKFNYQIGNHIFYACLFHRKLSQVFNKFLCDYIGNCCDHVKMYPRYLEMGYSPEKFLTNGHAEKCSIKDIKRLRLKFLWQYSPTGINRYIGYLLSIYADHMDKDYSEHLRLLHSKAPELFRIVSDFWDKWTKFDIEKIDPVYNSDLEIAECFVGDMEKWVRKMD